MKKAEARVKGREEARAATVRKQSEVKKEAEARVERREEARAAAVKEGAAEGATRTKLRCH